MCRRANTDRARENAAKQVARGNITHGKASTYSLYGCRCLACWEAASVHERKRRAKAVADDNIDHGTRTGYQYGCRCEPCRDAGNAYDRARYARGAARPLPPDVCGP